MTLGKGITYSTLWKQKLNTKSSTEAELVAIDNTMVQILWTRQFLTAQGLHVPMITIYQARGTKDGKQDSHEKRDI